MKAYTRTGGRDGWERNNLLAKETLIQWLSLIILMWRCTIKTIPQTSAERKIPSPGWFTRLGQSSVLSQANTYQLVCDLTHFLTGPILKASVNPFFEVRMPEQYQFNAQLCYFLKLIDKIKETKINTRVSKIMEQLWYQFAKRAWPMLIVK